jgi:aromatic ring-opening dioxygenase catalytic subunit (LigB family)
MSRMPVVFLPHGGGPWPFVDLGIPPAEHAALSGWLQALPGRLPAPPRALLVVSAHWEAPQARVQTNPQPPLLYDYRGFPEAAYRLRWDAPGSPALAARVGELLDAAGIAHDTDDQRGFDHGTFVPLKVAWPGAEVPTVQLSLLQGLDPAAHLALGRALAPLRDEGVLLLGSGMSFHNLRMFFGRAPRKPGAAEAFHAWLRDTVTAAPGPREAALLQWATAPGARVVHPREEHLLPLHVVAGAAGADPGQVLFDGSFLRFPILAAGWGMAAA